MPRPNVGERAPDFTLPNAEDKAVRLGELLAQKVVVLYFYPKDETAGCTVEACGFRDVYEDFVAAGAEVVGVSRDDAASHTRFATHHKLPFTLLTDADGNRSRALRDPDPPGASLRRSGDVRHRSVGIVRQVFTSMIDMRGHVQSSLRAVRELAGPAASAARNRVPRPPRSPHVKVSLDTLDRGPYCRRPFDGTHYETWSKSARGLRGSRRRSSR